MQQRQNGPGPLLSCPRHSLVLLLSLALSTLVACSSDEPGERATDVCEGESCPAQAGDGDSDGGGEACSADAECDSGYYCKSGRCGQDCIPGQLSCPNLMTCSSSGRCVSTNPLPDASLPNLPMVDAGHPTDTCADTVLSTTRVKPRVVLIIDQSGSMDADFSSPDGSLTGSRWTVLRDFLLQAGGLIDGLQDVVQFGLAMYSARSLPDNAMQTEAPCPIISTVAPTLNNLPAIDTTLSAADPIDETPTGDAIDAIVSDLELDNFNPDEQEDPVVFILATDGEPDTCEAPNPQNGQQEAIDAVTRAFDLGIRTFVISVGDGVSAQHQQDIANAGLGRPLDNTDPAQYWTAGDGATLADALNQIVGGQLSCDIALNGAIDGDNECLGTVSLKGVPLPCNDPNGWEKVDPEHIRLLGSACDELKSGDAFVEARFPCEVQVNIVN